MKTKLNPVAMAVLGILSLALTVPGITVAEISEIDSAKKLRELQNNFGPVLKLKGPAQKEINVIANLISPGSKLVAIDATKASGEMCMLETVTKRNMIHYSEKPEQTREDIIYYINPDSLIANGLDVSKLPRHPDALGEMVPLQWYYYDGTYVEPHQGGQLNKKFLIMAIDVK